MLCEIRDFGLRPEGERENNKDFTDQFSLHYLISIGKLEHKRNFYTSCELTSNFHFTSR